MVTGDPVQYVASGGFITPALADDVLYRKAHPEPKRKPAGLDWGNLTPTCPGCSEKSGQIDGTGLCPACRGDIAVNRIQPNVTTDRSSTYATLHEDDVQARFTAPTQTPQDEVPSPAVPMPRPAAPTARPTVRAKVTRTSPHDVLITLRSTADPIDQLAVAALLNDLLTGLHPNPAAAATPSAAAAPQEARRRPVGKPARRASTPKQTRAPRIDFDLTEAIRLYTDEQFSCPMVAERLGCAVSTVQRHLKAANIPLRDDRQHRSGGRNAKTTDHDDPHMRDAIVARYQGGESTIAIGRALDRSTKYVNAVLRRAGVTLRPKASVGRPITDDDRRTIVDRYTAGDNLVTIARALELGKNRVRTVVVEAGIPLRPKGGQQPPTSTPTAAIRAWAQEHQLIDPTHTAGRLPLDVIAAYEAAHPSSTPTEGEAA